MNEVIKHATEIAEKILSKELNPNEGCTQISELSQNNEFLEELQIFELLAHEQHGHEHIGITEENTTPQIIEECERLVNKNS